MANALSILPLTMNATVPSVLAAQRAKSTSPKSGFASLVNMQTTNVTVNVEHRTQCARKSFLCLILAILRPILALQMVYAHVTARNFAPGMGNVTTLPKTTSANVFEGSLALHATNCLATTTV